LEEETTIEVKGRDLITGLPKLVKVNSEEIRQALDPPIREIIEATKVTLERTPPELAADLIERGIVMCGGGSLLKGLDKLIADETGLPVIVADDPLTAVALGTGKVLEEIKYLKKISLASST
jgi:rod shape-determining protein MreB